MPSTARRCAAPRRRPGRNRRQSSGRGRGGPRPPRSLASPSRVLTPTGLGASASAARFWRPLVDGRGSGPGAGSRGEGPAATCAPFPAPGPAAPRSRKGGASTSFFGGVKAQPVVGARGRGLGRGGGRGQPAPSGRWAGLGRRGAGGSRASTARAASVFRRRRRPSEAALGSGAVPHRRPLAALGPRLQAIKGVQACDSHTTPQLPDAPRGEVGPPTPRRGRSRTAPPTPPPPRPRRRLPPGPSAPLLGTRTRAPRRDERRRGAGTRSAHAPGALPDPRTRSGSLPRAGRIPTTSASRKADIY